MIRIDDYSDIDPEKYEGYGISMRKDRDDIREVVAIMKTVNKRFEDCFYYCQESILSYHWVFLYRNADIPEVTRLFDAALKSFGFEHSKRNTDKGDIIACPFA